LSKYRIIAGYDVDSAIFQFLKESEDPKNRIMISKEIERSKDLVVNHVRKLVAGNKIKEERLGKVKVYSVD